MVRIEQNEQEIYHLPNNLEKIQRYTLRIDREIFRKFRYIADYEGRSANREIALYIKKRVTRFETLYGSIETTEFL